MTKLNIANSDASFAEDLQDSQSTSEGVLCVFGDHTFVPLTWMSKRQTAVPHCSTEIKIISLDAGLRSEGLFALQVRDNVLDVLSLRVMMFWETSRCIQ